MHRKPSVSGRPTKWGEAAFREGTLEALEGRYLDFIETSYWSSRWMKTAEVKVRKEGLREGTCVHVCVREGGSGLSGPSCGMGTAGKGVRTRTEEPGRLSLCLTQNVPCDLSEP